jgi:hypothetical protein
MSSNVNEKPNSSLYLVNYNVEPPNLTMIVPQQGPFVIFDPSLQADLVGGIRIPLWQTAAFEGRQVIRLPLDWTDGRYCSLFRRAFVEVYLPRSLKGYSLLSEEACPAVSKQSTAQ